MWNSEIESARLIGLGEGGKVVRFGDRAYDSNGIYELVPTRLHSGRMLTLQTLHTPHASINECCFMSSNRCCTCYYRLK